MCPPGNPARGAYNRKITISLLVVLIFTIRHASKLKKILVLISFFPIRIKPASLGFTCERSSSRPGFRATDLAFSCWAYLHYLTLRLYIILIWRSITRPTNFVLLVLSTRLSIIINYYQDVN